eukprot:832651-Prymnesium_polylepis.1
MVVPSQSSLSVRPIIACSRFIPGSSRAEFGCVMTRGSLPHGVMTRVAQSDICVRCCENTAGLARPHAIGGRCPPACTVPTVCRLHRRGGLCVLMRSDPPISRHPSASQDEAHRGP